MKSIVPDNFLQILSRHDKQELVDQQRKEFKLIGSQRLVRGLTLYEYDLTTGTLSRASSKKEIQLTIDGAEGANVRVDCKELCLYVQALNEENAMRKIRQMLRRNSTRKQLFNQKKNGK